MLLYKANNKLEKNHISKRVYRQGHLKAYCAVRTKLLIYAPSFDAHIMKDT